MAFCESCGKEVNEGAVICHHCGVAVAKSHPKSGGGAIVVVLVVIVILVVLGGVGAAIAIPAYNGYIRSSQERVAMNTAATVAAAASAYLSDYPESYSKIDALYCGYGGSISIGDWPINIPDDYKCDIEGAEVVVTHKDGAEGRSR